MENNLNIRPPDNPIREILINNTNYNTNYNTIYNDIYNDEDDYDLQLVITESIKEQEIYDKKQIEILNKTKLRFQSFKNILFQIKKISLLDKNILDFYNIVQPIIDLYCAGDIDNYECDKNMYDDIFNTLKTIRITDLEFDLFKNVFVIDK
jgi:hypothetical protein